MHCFERSEYSKFDSTEFRHCKRYFTPNTFRRYPMFKWVFVALRYDFKNVESKCNYFVYSLCVHTSSDMVYRQKLMIAKCQGNNNIWSTVMIVSLSDVYRIGVLTIYSAADQFYWLKWTKSLFKMKIFLIGFFKTLTVYESVCTNITGNRFWENFMVSISHQNKNIAQSLYCFKSPKLINS